MHYSGRIAVILSLFTCLAGTGNTESAVLGGKVSISGMVEIETAEMLKARLNNTRFENITWSHAWNEHLLATLNFKASPLEYLTLRGSFEFRQYSLFSPVLIGTYNLGDLTYGGFSLREGQGIFSLFRSEASSAEAAIGLMPYKYSSEVRELGEFLFRSGTYPFMLNTDFDRPFARLTGLRGSYRYQKGLLDAKLDVMALTERETRPYWDISLAVLGSLNVGRIIDLGAGVDFAHCIPMNNNYTTPKSSKTQYVKDSVMDTVGTIIYDYDYYTFKGTKLMAHATIDPLGMIRGDKGSIVNQLCGENGGKIYGEWAIIGLENYPANNSNPHGYDKLKEKMPWMLGINIPLWKILDICAFEIERYPNPYPNSSYNIVRDGIPVPYASLNVMADYDSTVYQPRWYWSLYLKKQIVKNFSLVCQIGRDHIRWEMPLNYQVIYYDYEEAMVRPDQWGWHFKMEFSF